MNKHFYGVFGEEMLYTKILVADLKLALYVILQYLIPSNL
jgi:hypothetical protein